MYLRRDMDFVIHGGKDAISAIYFVDGGLGGLLKYSQYGSTVCFTNGVSETWIYFCEAFHDVVENIPSICGVTVSFI